MRRALLLAALAGLACSSSRPTLSAGVSAPSAIVAFTGKQAVHPGELRTYLAVASSRSNELRLVDPSEERPVLGPTLVFPLSVPTDARPMRLAAASLGDGGADLLAVATTGELVSLDPAQPATTAASAVEIVVTWDDKTRLAQSQAIAIPPGSEVSAIAAAGLRDAAGPLARLVVALSRPAGGQLLVFDFRRGDQGSLVHGVAATQDVPFRAADLAFSPDGALLFAATADALPGTAGSTYGVAQLAVALDPAAPWPLSVLDARAPTTSVRAANVAERTLTDAGGVPAASPNVFPEGAAPLRVYALLDPAGCGETRAIRCGLATLVPDLPGNVPGLAADPAASVGPGAMPYRAPLEIPAVPLAVAISGPAARPFDDSLCRDPAQNPSPAVATMRLQLATKEQRCTTAVAAIPSSNGETYLADLGRFELPSERSVVVTATERTRVTSAISAPPPGSATPQLALVGADGAPTIEQAGLAAAIRVTPGFTPTDIWNVQYQAILPGLALRRGVVVRSGGVPWLAAQVEGRGPNGEVVWVPTATLVSPELGVHADDLVELVADEAVACTDGAPATTALGEAPIAAPPDPASRSATFPAGAVRLPEGCWSAALAEGASRPVTFTVRASGLLLTSIGTGYAGRPPLVAAGEAPVPFALEWTAAADPGAAREAANEAQVLARKARRRFYPAEYAGCPPGGCEGFPGLPHPLAHGPVVAFSVVAVQPPARGASVVFNTDGSLFPTARLPAGAVLPTGAAAVDRSSRDPGAKNTLEVRFYVGYADDQIYVFGPGEAVGTGFSIR